MDTHYYWHAEKKMSDGSVKKSEGHCARSMEGACAGGYKMLKQGWTVVKIGSRGWFSHDYTLNVDRTGKFGKKGGIYLHGRHDNGYYGLPALSADHYVNSRGEHAGNLKYNYHPAHAEFRKMEKEIMSMPPGMRKNLIKRVQGRKS